MLFFPEFLNEPKVIVYLSSLFCKMLHYIARFQRDSFWAFQPPLFDLASRQCAQVLVDYFECNVSTGVGFSGKGCASFWAHLHPAFEASLPGENPKCFERKIFF